MALLIKALAATVAMGFAASHPHGGSASNSIRNSNDLIATLGDAAAQCGNYQQISCCDKGNSAGTLLDNLLGRNCSPLDLSPLTIDVPISTACSNQLACCTSDQNGLLNLACTDLNL